LSVLRQINARDPVTSQDFQLLQDNVQAALTPLQALPFVGGNLVTGLQFDTDTADTDLVVNHGLGRQVQQFWPLSQQAAGSVYLSPSRNPSPGTQIILRSSVAGMQCSVYFV